MLEAISGSSLSSEKLIQHGYSGEANTDREIRTTDTAQVPVSRPCIGGHLGSGVLWTLRLSSEWSEPPLFPESNQRFSRRSIVVLSFHHGEVCAGECRGGRAFGHTNNGRGGASLQLNFGRVSNTGSMILLAVILEALAFISTLPGRSLSIISGLDVLTQVILIVAFASLIWEYSISSWGLHKVGSSHLKLKSFL